MGLGSEIKKAPDPGSGYATLPTTICIKTYHILVPLICSLFCQVKKIVKLLGVEISPPPLLQSSCVFRGVSWAGHKCPRSNVPGGGGEGGGGANVLYLSPSFLFPFSVAKRKVFFLCPQMDKLDKFYRVVKSPATFRDLASSFFLLHPLPLIPLSVYTPIFISTILY
jgi:hypothetical protein